MPDVNAVQIPVYHTILNARRITREDGLDYMPPPADDLRRWNQVGSKVAALNRERDDVLQPRPRAEWVASRSFRAKEEGRVGRTLGPLVEQFIGIRSITDPVR